MIPGMAKVSKMAEIRTRIYGAYPFNGSRQAPVVAESAGDAGAMGVAVVIISYDTLWYVALRYLANSYRAHLTWIGDKDS